MKVEPLAIPDVLLITPKRHGDARGWFTETFTRRAFAEAGLDDDFVQENHAYSQAQGTLRGLHLQIPPKPISKLIRCVAGAIFDVAVDVRAGSLTYGLWTGAELSAANGCSLYVPRGFAHAYLTLTPDAEVLYKQDGYWAPDCERGLRWDDPAIGIDWPAPAASLTINDRDRALPVLSAFAPVIL
jgi:dTDP-4-dehydrorhamnose 3,5-epimerase